MNSPGYSDSPDEDQSMEDEDGKVAAEAPSKKPKLSEMDGPGEIFTFTLSHSPLKIQLLSKHSLYDLVSFVCEVSSVGDTGSDTADNHLWDIKVPRKGKFVSQPVLFESNKLAENAKLGNLGLKEGDEMKLLYDYGARMDYQFTVGKIQKREETAESDSDFPRIEATELPAGYTKFSTTDIDLNAKFSTLNEWMFEEQGRNVDICLFRAGKKPIFGYLERGINAISHMIFMPAEPAHDLADYLHCLNAAARLNPNGGYNWFSVIVIPRKKLTKKLEDLYGDDLKPGFCEMEVVDESMENGFNNFFPKVAALAGFHKDPKIKRGWITYKDGFLRICSGSALPVKCQAPEGTAFHGAQQHQPSSPADVVMEAAVAVKSLHDLFCTVEGLLGTVG